MFTFYVIINNIFNKFIVIAVVIYLFSISDIFALLSVFLTKLLTSGILFPTLVNAALVAKPVTLGILISISVILAL